MSSPNFKATRRACYYTYLAMSSVFSLPPVLFVTFREMYGISYTFLGTLVLVNFCTQLAIDLIFSLFSSRFNPLKTVQIMPLLTSLGLVVYALVPAFFPQYAYVGLLVGTVIFSVSAGLCEVLLSPTVAALPSNNPERDMSTLHSLYAYGVVGVVLVSTLFLQLFGRESWMFLTLFWAVLPLISFVLFHLCPMPHMDLTQENGGQKAPRKGFGMALCVLCIFLGSASENAMTNWISGYMEKALHISKALGDVLGLASFAVLLGLGRTWYAKRGKNITAVLLWGMVGAIGCYLVAGLVNHPAVCLAACTLTGLCTSMLWPGMLIFMEEKFPAAGVTAYALMAAGGDFGGSVGPQLLGIVADQVSLLPQAAQWGRAWGLSPEQIGLKAGMLVGALFPLLGLVAVLYMKRYFAHKKATAV
ncbi:MAG: MFS transporter [Clostridia bacterium]|nr:MFS transporter [Clostridia bacterium]